MPTPLKSLIMRPFVNSKWRNLIYAKFICWPWYIHRAFVITCSGICVVLRSNQWFLWYGECGGNRYLYCAMQPQLAVVMAAFFNFLACYWADLALPMPLSICYQPICCWIWGQLTVWRWSFPCCWRRLSGTRTWFFGLPPPVRTPWLVRLSASV